MDAVHELVVIAVDKVIPADTIVEKGIPREDDTLPHQADTAGGMPGGMKDREMKFADVDTIATL